MLSTLLVAVAVTAVGCVEQGDEEPTLVGADTSGTTPDAGGDARSPDGGGADATPETVTASVQLQTAFSGGLSEAEVAYRDQSATTGEAGSAELDVEAESAFEIVASKSGYWDHRLLGRAGSEDFPYISFVAGESTTSQVFGRVDVEVDDSKGILVVGVDTPQLEPVVGSSVSIDAEHDQPITLGSAGADSDADIEEGEQGFVSFPNVSPGDVEITVDAPAEKSCELYPGGSPRPDFTVEAGTVTIVSFVCE